MQGQVPLLPGVPRRPLVGAGRRRRAAGTPARDVTGKRSPISAPRPGARPRTRICRREGYGGRPLGQSAGARARNLARLSLHAITGRGRPRRMAGGTFDRCSSTRLFVHRPRSAATLMFPAQARGRHRFAHWVQRRPARPRDQRSSQAAGSSIACAARAGGRRAADRGAARPARAPCARIPIAPGEIGGIDPFVTAAGDLRTLPSHWEDEDPRWAVGRLFRRTPRKR